MLINKSIQEIQSLKNDLLKRKEEILLKVNKDITENEMIIYGSKMIEIGIELEKINNKINKLLKKDK